MRSYRIAAVAAIVVLVLVVYTGCKKKDDKPFYIPPLLEITTTVLPYAVNGQVYSQAVEAAGGKEPYTWSITANNPPNPVTIDPATGVLSGTPSDAPGDYTFTVEVLDSRSKSATRDLTITLYNPLDIATVSLPDGVNGQSYGPEQLTATGGAMPYTWSEDGTGLSTFGLTLNSDGTITGTPTQTGTCNFTARVTDSGNPAQETTKALSISIFGVTTTTLPDGVNGQSYGPGQLTATSGVMPYAWSEDGSNLASYGLTLNPDGSITGTATQAGTCSFTARVTDSDVPAREATKTLEIAVYEVLVITSTTLTEAKDGEIYGPEQLTASGGKTPYAWSEVGSNLATYGLTLNSDGTITGTPTQAGICSFTAEVTDSSTTGQSAQKALTLLVLEQPFVKTWGGTGLEETTGVALDSDGNVYCVSRTGSFGAGNEDALILKYNTSGALQWAKTWGGADWEFIYGVAVDTTGNTYCAGCTWSFGAGAADALLLKYNSSGTLQWARTWGGSSDDYFEAIAVDSDNNIYCAGETKNFGAGSCGALLVKYDSSGTLQWAKIWDSSADIEYIYGVAVDSGGSIYCAGSTRIFSTGEEDTLLLKYDSSGSLQWARTWGGTDDDEIGGVGVDSGGSVFCAGRTASFGAGDWDVLLLKYSSSGTLQWAKTWGGTDWDYSRGVAVDSGGNIYCAGETYSFGAGMRDALLLKYDTSGSCQWARTWGGGYGDSILSPVVDANQNIFLGGVSDSYGLVCAWQTITTGTEGNPSGTENTPTGTEISPVGTENSPTGTETSPTGSETGGGQYDALLLKNW